MAALAERVVDVAIWSARRCIHSVKPALPSFSLLRHDKGASWAMRLGFCPQKIGTIWS